MSKADSNHAKKSNSDLIDFMHKSKIFSEIDRKGCELLLPLLDRVKLPQNKILFKQNDTSDCMYLLVEGQLLALLATPEGEHKIVGAIEKGETVGELGALSNQPRTLTIRAATDCLLLKLTKKIFADFSRAYPQFTAHLVDLIIQRSQNTFKVISQKKLYQHIAIIMGDDNIPIDKFKAKLMENYTTDHKFSLILDQPTDSHLADKLEQAEQNNKSVIFMLNQGDLSDLKIKLNHIGGIFVVVDGDAPGKLSDFALDMLSKARTPFATQYELVLLHDDKSQKPADTAKWQKQAEFTLHHHIHTEDNLDYQRLLRFMKGKAIGVVLGGGGSKGWVSLGVLKALIESDIPIDIIGGTSVGAVVAACYALSMTYEGAYESFKKLVTSNLRPFSLQHITWPIISFVSTQKITEALHEVCGDTKCEDLWIPFFSIASNLSRSIEVTHNEGILWQVLRATIAIPGLTPPMVINGELFVDGGLVNNLPVNNMRHTLGTESLIIAVSLTGTDENITCYNFPPILPFHIGLLRKLKLGYNEYTFPPYLNTFLQAMLLGSSAKEKVNQAEADILINPNLSKHSTFDVSIKKSEELIEIGYQLMLEKLHTYPFMFFSSTAKHSRK